MTYKITCVKNCVWPFKPLKREFYSHRSCAVVGFMAFKGFLTVIPRKVQRHGDVVIRSHTARSQPNHTRREQSLTNTMLGERKKKKYSTSNLHFRANVEVLGQSEINTFSLAETDLTKISNCHNKHKSLHFYTYQGTCR